MTFDDRLTDPDDVEELLDVCEEIVAEMAEDHYGRCYPDGVCVHCIRDTPISKEWGPWMSMATELDDMIEDVEARVESMGRDPHWVMSSLSGVYFEEFHESAVEPDECSVCNDGGIDGCGHEMDGEDCPV